MANSIAYASKYAAQLDKKFVQESVTAIFENNNKGLKFENAHTVYLPELELVGLGNYSRASGFPVGDVTLTRRSYALTKERGREFFIDNMDTEESGVAGLIGQVCGEYMKQHVAPEVDAYSLSTLWGVANTNSNTEAYTSSTPLGQMIALIDAANDACGFQELVCFVNAKTAWTDLRKSSELTKMLEPATFKAGELSFKVKKIDNCFIIPVTSNRMKSAYTFNAGATSSAGGFTAASGAKTVDMLVVPRSAPMVIKKHDKLRVFGPEVNQDKDGTKVQYRLYYDALIKQSDIGTVFAAHTTPAG
jgi:hypothetical protein